MALPLLSYFPALSSSRDWRSLGHRGQNFHASANDGSNDRIGLGVMAGTTAPNRIDRVSIRLIIRFFMCFSSSCFTAVRSLFYITYQNIDYDRIIT